MRCSLAPHTHATLWAACLLSPPSSILIRRGGGAPQAPSACRAGPHLPCQRSLRSAIVCRCTSYPASLRKRGFPRAVLVCRPLVCRLIHTVSAVFQLQEAHVIALALVAPAFKSAAARIWHARCMSPPSAAPLSSQVAAAPPASCTLAAQGPGFPRPYHTAGTPWFWLPLLCSLPYFCFIWQRFAAALPPTLLQAPPGPTHNYLYCNTLPSL